MTAHLHLPGARDPTHLLDRTLEAWGERGDLWIFGYASLIWRPEFEAAEERPAKVHGWHRALAMRSRVNRGTPECPGLVFALIPGGSCQGRAYRIEESRVDTELRRLWGREMPTGVSAGEPRPRRLARTIPAMAITTSTATASMARVREELRGGGSLRSSIVFPVLGAADSSWR